MTLACSHLPRPAVIVSDPLVAIVMAAEFVFAAQGFVSRVAVRFLPGDAAEMMCREGTMAIISKRLCSMRTRGKRWLQTLARVYRNYVHHSGPMMAAAIAFYSILSIVPLLSLGVAVLGFVLGSSAGASHRVASAIQEALPASSDLIARTLEQIRKTSGVATIVSVIGLLLPGSAIFNTMEAALHQMRGAGPRRGWLARKVVALVLALVTLVLLLASVAVTSVVAWLQEAGPSFGLWRGLQPRFVALEAQAATLGMSVLMFAVIYRFLPNPPLPWRRTLAGAVFAGIAWEFAKYLFSLYLRSLGHFNRVYGPLGAVVSLMVWALYSAAILLLGAELAADTGASEPGYEAVPADDTSSSARRRGSARRDEP